jgi:uncharacterized membrane protein YfcA
MRAVIELLAGVASGLLAGVLSGVFGIGGGIVLVPLLALLLGLGQREAQGVTLAVLLLPIGLPAVLAYHRMAPIRWRLVAILVAGFLAGVGLGAEVANRVPQRPLALGFAAFLFYTAVRTWGGRGATRPEAPAPPSVSQWHGLWIGALAGVLSGLLGIGGGVVMIGLLVSVLGMSQHEAQGASLATMLPPIGLPGVLVYARSGQGLPLLLMGAVAAGFGAGAWMGARVAVRVEGRNLGRGFALFLAAVAAAMAWKALR